MFSSRKREHHVLKTTIDFHRFNSYVLSAKSNITLEYKM